jgi:hypothetical protein
VSLAYNSFCINISDDKDSCRGFKWLSEDIKFPSDLNILECDNPVDSYKSWHPEPLKMDPIRRPKVAYQSVSRGTQTDPVLIIEKPPIMYPKKPVSDYLLNHNENDQKATFYTGLNKEKRDALWEFLGDAKYQLEMIGKKPTTISCDLRNISVQCQFLMTLEILRRNRSYQELYHHYWINPGLISQIFKTWVQFMYSKFRDLKNAMFVRKCDIQKPLPRHFRNKMLHDTRVVIDCTECVCESTANYTQQGILWSSYKHRQTAKALIGVLPSGACCYISECFGGSISDRQIVVKSDFLDYIEPGDLVLADRGFTVDDLVREKGGTLVIPPFLNQRPSFRLEEVQRTKVIAKARIHIERFNERFKNFKMLDPPIPQYHMPMISQLVYICCCFANFSTTLAQ